MKRAAKLVYRRLHFKLKLNARAFRPLLHPAIAKRKGTCIYLGMPYRLLFLASLFFASAVCSSANDRPNIVVIICDDLGYGDLACYGHPDIRTPHLNRMAAEGIRFTDFYSTAPVCSASRVGLLTGRSPNRAGVYDWIPPGNQIKPDARDQVHMRRDEVTIAHLLKEAGYATAMSGKWHCNSKFNSAEQPQPGDAGFDHWFATHNNAAPSHENPNNFVRNGEPVGPIEGYSCQIVTDEAIEWMEGQNRENPNQPFFLYIAYHEPHEPVASPADIVATYRDVAANEKQAAYYANVDNIDRAVGKLHSALKRLDIDENTLVVFTSDNGPETLNRYTRASYSYGVATPLRGMKLWTTDAGFRVAGIARWPGTIAPGQVQDQVISALDLLPTFCALANKSPPQSLALDGVDIRTAFGGDIVHRDKPLIWAFYNAINEERVAMRDGKWKALAKLNLPKFQNLHDGNLADVRAATLTDFELYDMSADIGEVRNLASSRPEKLAELSRKLTQGYQELLHDSYVWKRQIQ